MIPNDLDKTKTYILNFANGHRMWPLWWHEEDGLNGWVHGRPHDADSSYKKYRSYFSSNSYHEHCFGLSSPGKWQITENFSVLPLGFCGGCSGPKAYGLDYLCGECRGL